MFVILLILHLLSGLCRIKCSNRFTKSICDFTFFPTSLKELISMGVGKESFISVRNEIPVFPRFYVA